MIPLKPETVTPEEIPPALKKRLAQLGGAYSVLSIESRKLMGELRKVGITFPDLIVYILGNLDKDAFSLRIVLDKGQLIRASNQTGWDNSLDPDTLGSQASAPNGREAAPE